MKLYMFRAVPLPETCRVSCRSKFGKLVNLVGFYYKETRNKVTSDRSVGRSVGMNAKRIDVPFQAAKIHLSGSSPRAHSPNSSRKGNGSSSPADKAEGSYSHDLASHLVQRLMLRNTDSSPPPPHPPHDTSGEVIG